MAKLFLILALVSALLMASINVASTARPLLNLSPSSSPTLVARLKLDDNGSDQSLSCWDSLIQLQACTSEIILFFLNGETYLGHGCCEAIRVIANQCWPNMMDTLGFTSEEGDILEGFCDHKTSDSDQTPPPSSSPPPSVGLTRVSTIKTSVVP